MSDQFKRNATLVDHMGSLLRDEAHALSTGPQLLRRILEEGAWREFTTKMGDHVAYDNFAPFIATPPLKGLGAGLDLVRRVASADPVTLDLLDQALQRPSGHPSKSGNNIPSSGRPEGTTKAKALRKLRKDAPDLHADVLAGKLSAHRAMVQAGYRPRTLSVRLDDPEAAAKSLRTHMEPADLMKLIQILAEAAADVLLSQKDHNK